MTYFVGSSHFLPILEGPIAADRLRTTTHLKVVLNWKQKDCHRLYCWMLHIIKTGEPVDGSIFVPLFERSGAKFERNQYLRFQVHQRQVAEKADGNKVLLPIQP